MRWVVAVAPALLLVTVPPSATIFGTPHFLSNFNTHKTNIWGYAHFSSMLRLMQALVDTLYLVCMATRGPSAVPPGPSLQFVTEIV
jgi:hypothetical protein